MKTTNNKINLKEEFDSLRLSDLGEEVATNYNDGHLCDIITEVADSNIDIYNCDLLEWAKSHLGEIEEAAKEFGATEDIIKAIQQGQFYVYSGELYEELEYIIKGIALDYLISIDAQITAEQLEELFSRLDEIDNGNTFDDIREIATEIMNVE